MSNDKELKALNFEISLSIIFIILSLLNIWADIEEKEYVRTHKNKYKIDANKIFKITIFVSILIYIYYFIRNYNAYENTSKNNKKLFAIKLWGSSLYIAGALCLLYFQNKQTSFLGTPIS